MEYSVYCDESCHLEHDCHKAMGLGGIWVTSENVKKVIEEIRRIKIKHGLDADFEIKWTKVSNNRECFYAELLDYFFSRDDLCFRAVVIPDKSLLRHNKFDQDHDTWYYKMYYLMLKPIIMNRGLHRVYLDIKDTRSARKIRKLHEVINNTREDSILGHVKSIQTIRSEESLIVQLSDLIIGLITYVNNGIFTNNAKHRLSIKFCQKSGVSLTKTTTLSSSKINILIWQSNGEK